MGFKKGNQLRKGIKNPEQSRRMKGNKCHFKGGWINRKGYRAIGFNGRTVNESHLIWCSQPGNLPFIPSGFAVHHLNGIKTDNSPANLILLSFEDHNWFHATLQHSIFNRCKEVKLWPDI